MENKKRYLGLGLFQLEVIHLISAGKKETWQAIEQEMGNRTLIEYIYNKYRQEFSVPFDNSLYQNDSLNELFYNYYGYIQGNERRKYKVMNEDDGLLLILSMISDFIEQNLVT